MVITPSLLISYSNSNLFAYVLLCSIVFISQLVTLCLHSFTAQTSASAAVALLFDFSSSTKMFNAVLFCRKLRRLFFLFLFPLLCFHNCCHLPLFLQNCGKFSLLLLCKTRSISTRDLPCFGISGSPACFPAYGPLPATVVVSGPSSSSSPTLLCFLVICAWYSWECKPSGLSASVSPAVSESACPMLRCCFVTFSCECNL